MLGFLFAGGLILGKGMSNKKITMLIRAYRKGDNSAFDELVLLTYQDLYRLCYGYLKDKMLAEDMVSEVYLKLVESRGIVKNEKNLQGLLRVIATNKCLDLLKKTKREIPVEVNVLDNTHFAKQEPEEVYSVQQVLLMMEADEREGLLLHTFGFPVREIAYKMGLSVGQARMLLERSKKSFAIYYKKGEVESLYE